jgi:tetratricopeptide (TPR) repeat protein
VYVADLEKNSRIQVFAPSTKITAIEQVTPSTQTNLQSNLDQTISSSKHTILSSKTNSTADLIKRGVGLFRLGKYNEAISLFDKVLAIDPNDTYALGSKAAALAVMGKYNEAISLFDKVLAIDPNNTDALTRKVASLAALNRYDEAINTLDEALQPNDARLLGLKGTINPA